MNPFRRRQAPGPDAAAEVARGFNNMELSRYERFYSQQICSLAGRYRHEPAWTPPEPLLAELRVRVQAALANSVVEPPKRLPLEGGVSYYGVVLRGLWEDDRPLSPEDVPLVGDPVSGHPERDRGYRVIESWIHDRESDQWHPAPGLEDWILEISRVALREPIRTRMLGRQRRRLLATRE